MKPPRRKPTGYSDYGWCCPEQPRDCKLCGGHIKITSGDLFQMTGPGAKWSAHMSCMSKESPAPRGSRKPAGVAFPPDAGAAGTVLAGARERGAA